ncbi:hypothetical protein H8E88_34830 [candidate division KSB1 bacterium]|nr:hypothetical protein [candidate division KSB1 bacterium]MBL7092739.1 hypothetical protein [candidate division KSB1 bacterium]
MQIDCNAIFNDVFSNLIFSIGSFLIVLYSTYCFIIKSRSKRLRFLQINKDLEISILPIFVAHLVIVKRGALLANGTPSNHFEGSAVPLKEVNAARLIEKKLSSSILEIIPQKILSLLTKFSRGFIPLNIIIDPAPLDVNKVKHFPRAILIGGPEFNKATEYFLERAKIFRILEPGECDKPTISIKSRAGGEELITPDSPDQNLSIIERISFDNGKQVIVLLSGVGTNGTLAAVDWFLKNWDKLNKKVKMQDFGICLQCPKRSVDPDGYRLWTLRREYPEGILTGNIF